MSEVYLHLVRHGESFTHAHQNKEDGLPEVNRLAYLLALLQTFASIETQKSEQRWHHQSGDYDAKSKSW